MSIVEVLIAAALLLAIAVGILPLMMRAIANNFRGWEATVVSNEAKSEMDRLISGPVDGPLLTVGVGSTSLLRDESWTQGNLDELNDVDEGWQAGAPTGMGPILHNRRITVRQYNIADLWDRPDGLLGNAGFRHFIVETADLDDQARDGNTRPELIHLKQVEILTEGAREGGALGAGQKLYVRMIKIF